MKQVTVILFSLFYLLTTVGFSLNVHYCGGNISTVNLVSEPSCCCSSEKDADNCCDDEVIRIQVDDVQNNTPSQRIDITLFSTIVTVIYNTTLIPIEEKLIRHDLLDLPPPNKRPVWLLNNSRTLFG